MHGHQFITAIEPKERSCVRNTHVVEKSGVKWSDDELVPISKVNATTPG